MNGYTCDRCGVYVGWGQFHQCHNPAFNSQTVLTNAPTESTQLRMAMALERIAMALESQTNGTRNVHEEVCRCGPEGCPCAESKGSRADRAEPSQDREEDVGVGFTD